VDKSSFSCVAIAEGHTGDVAAIAFAKFVERFEIFYSIFFFGWFFV